MSPVGADASLSRDVSLSFHADVLDETNDGGGLFWFADAADLLQGVRRKLGISDTDGLVARIEALGVDLVEACCDPCDEGRLLVAPDVETLRTLAASRSS